MAANKNEDETVLGIPVCRLGVGVTAYWLPLRPDISLAQLPVLLANCGTPKQALLVPNEILTAGKEYLPTVCLAAAINATNL